MGRAGCWVELVVGLTQVELVVGLTQELVELVAEVTGHRSRQEITGQKTESSAFYILWTVPQSVQQPNKGGSIFS